MTLTVDQQKIHRMNGLKEQRKKLIAARPNRQQLYYVFHSILNQRKLSYSKCQAICYNMRCFFCLSESRLKKSKRSKSDFYLNRGIKKLTRDLDISKLLEMVQVFKVMKQTLYN